MNQQYSPVPLNLLRSGNLEEAHELGRQLRRVAWLASRFQVGRNCARLRDPNREALRTSKQSRSHRIITFGRNLRGLHSERSLKPRRPIYL